MDEVTTTTEVVVGLDGSAGARAALAWGLREAQLRGGAVRPVTVRHLVTLTSGWGVGLERAAQVGSLIAALVLETVGPQEYEVKSDFFVKRFADSYGDEAAAEIARHLPA